MDKQIRPTVFESEAIEHIAVWAAEEGDTGLESWCDSALAGNEDERTLLDWARESGGVNLAQHMARGARMGWMARTEEAS